MTNEMLLRYMVAHIRMHTAADISRWTQDQIIESFATLPMPSVKPDEWARRMGLIEQEPEPSDEQINEARSKLLGAKVMSFVREYESKFPTKKEEAVA